jgi:hypothetical protein
VLRKPSNENRPNTLLKSMQSQIYKMTSVPTSEFRLTLMACDMGFWNLMCQYIFKHKNIKGIAVTQWLRFSPTNRKVAGSSPDDVIGFFRWHNPSDHTMALGSTQPPTEMSTRSISWGKGSRCVRLTSLPPSCKVVKKSGNLNFLKPSGSLQACNGTALPFYAITKCFVEPCVAVRNFRKTFI